MIGLEHISVKYIFSKQSISGTFPSTYINASLIEFPGYAQQFLAVQAPKPNMFDGFWQLVVEQNVTVIVMITRLVEGERVKAHQYWPEDDGVMSLDNGMTVRRTRKQYNGSSVYHRKFVV